MEIKGTIINALPIEEGVSKTTGKSWRKRTYILRTDDRYPKTVAFDLFNDNIDRYPMYPNRLYTVEIDIESREYNGRWYHSVSAWKVSAADAPDASAPAPQPVPTQFATPTAQAQPPMQQPYSAPAIQPQAAPQQYAAPQQPSAPVDEQFPF